MIPTLVKLSTNPGVPENSSDPGNPSNPGKSDDDTMTFTERPEAFVGLIAYAVTPRSPPYGRALFVQELFVGPGYRKRRVAVDLIREMLRALEGGNDDDDDTETFNEVHLLARRDNVAAMGLYIERLGMQELSPDALAQRVLVNNEPLRLNVKERCYLRIERDALMSALKAVEAGAMDVTFRLYPTLQRMVMGAMVLFKQASEQLKEEYPSRVRALILPKDVQYIMAVTLSAG